MAIDASIYGQIQQPQIQDPINALAKISQVQGLQNQNQLVQLKLAQDQRDVNDTNKLNALYQSAIGEDGKIDRNKLFMGAAQGGLGSKIPALQKQFSDSDKADADVGKTKADTAKTLQETAGHQFELAGQLAASWAQNPGVTKQQIASGLNAALNSKIISPDIAQAKLAEVSALPDDPRSLNQWAAGTLQQVMKAKDSMSFIAPDANTIANNQTSRANNAATNAVTMRGQNMTDARARDALEQKNRTDKETLKLQSATNQRINDSKDLLSLLDEADTLLPKATAGYIGQARDAAAGAFGKSTEGAQTTAQLKVLEGQLISKQPKMSGPQSDKDVQLYREMAGQLADASLPIGTRQAAARTMRGLATKYLDSQGVSAPNTATQGGVIDFGSLK